MIITHKGMNMNKFKIFFASLIFFLGSSSLYTQNYEQDANEVDFYVPGILANDAMQSVNFLLCFVENTNFQTFVDKGVYKALIDEAQCETADGADATADQAAATGSSAQSAAGGTANQVDDTEYTAGVFQNVTDNNTINGKAWVDLKLDFGGAAPIPVTAYVKTEVIADASESNRFGTFKMYYDLRNEVEFPSPIPGVNVPVGTEVERGYLDVDNTTIKYRMSGMEGPPRALDADLADTSNIQGILQHTVSWNIGGTRSFFSVKHKIYVNESSGNEQYCQKFLEAHQWSNLPLGVWSEGDEVAEAALNTLITDAKAAGAYIETDAGSDTTIVGEHCWDTRRSEAKRVIYEYGTYDNSVASNPRISLTTPAMSLEANTTDNTLQSPIWAHASYWGAHINPADRSNVTDSIKFRNQRDDTDNKLYNLKKNYYEITKREKQRLNLDQLGGVSFQMWVNWQKNDATWKPKMANLNFPVTAPGGSPTCNAAVGDCPEYSGTISVSGSTVTFNVTHGMDWENQIDPFELTTPFSFTAANWYSEMTDGSGWNLDMHFWDPDSHQSYYLPYIAFNAISTDHVITRVESKISIDDLEVIIANENTVDQLAGGAGATGIMCLQYCLSSTSINTSLGGAFNALANGTNPATPLGEPFHDVGPWFKTDTFFDTNGNNQVDAGEQLYPRGSYNNIGGIRAGEIANYTIVEDSGQKKFRDVLLGQILEYTNANKDHLDNRKWDDGLSNYRYREKQLAYSSAYNHERNFGWAFTMETMLNSDRMKALVQCDEDANNNARGYQAQFKAQIGFAPQHVTGNTEYYCRDKFYDLPLSFQINIKHMPDYRLYNETDATYVNVSAPETLVLNVDANNVTYNFSGTDFKNLAGKKYKLKFEGFGELHNLPGRVVNTCNDTIVGRYVRDWNPCYRFVHEFTIKDGTVLTNTNSARPDVKVRALRGDEYLKKINPTPTNITYTKEKTDLPTQSVLQTLASGNNAIGNKPNITLPSAGSNEASVVHGVTVHAPTN